MSDKHNLSDYTPEEIEQWQASAYPSASGRTWRRRLHTVIVAAVPPDALPLIEWLEEVLACVPPAWAFIPFLAVGVVLLVTSSMPTAAPFDTASFGLVPMTPQPEPLLRIYGKVLVYLSCLGIPLGLAFHRR